MCSGLATMKFKSDNRVRAGSTSPVADAVGAGFIHVRSKVSNVLSPWSTEMTRHRSRTDSSRMESSDSVVTDANWRMHAKNTGVGCRAGPPSPESETTQAREYLWELNRNEVQSRWIGGRLAILAESQRLDFAS